MRKMMMAAVLVLAACGNVEEPTPGMDMGSGSDGSGSAGGDGSGSGSGSGMGSGSGSGSSGMDAGMPAGCATAADCGASQGCDTATQMCVAETVAIDPGTDVVVDGSRWWTSVGDPILHGTYAGLPGATVQAIVGSAPGTVATLSGNAWTVKLPASSITGGDSWVRIVLSDPSGGHAEVDQLFTLDTAAPQITLATSKLRDERGDTIDFSTGEPVHTHAGAEIDLASGACPSVYKYGYLADATAPMYGSATSPNPLTWSFSITDTKLDATSPQFRVRNEANTTIMSWTAAPAADAAGVRHLTFTRNGGTYPLGALAYTGKYYIDVKARDWNGLETTVSWCFDNHPLAAPLQVDGFERAELFGMSLPADSQVSKVINIGSEFAVATQRIVQQTAEPVLLTWSATSNAIHYTKSVFWNYVEELTYSGALCSSSASACTIAADPTPVSPALTSDAGTIPTNRLHVVVRDESTNTVIASGSALALTGVQIPGRAANQPAHVYRVVIMSSALYELQPPSLDLWSTWATNLEQSLLGLTYTGPAKVKNRTSCANTSATAFGTMCQYAKTWWEVSALDHATVTFDGIAASVQLAGGPNQTPVAPSYIPAANLATGSLVWDSGDDDLPGPY
jgi:hypothetical protein